MLENALCDEAINLPEPVRQMSAIYLAQISNLTEVIEQLAAELAAATKIDEELGKLWKYPGDRPRHGQCRGGLRAGPRHLRQRAQFRGVARPCPAAEIHRREDEAWGRKQDRLGRHP